MPRWLPSGYRIARARSGVPDAVIMRREGAQLDRVGSRCGSGAGGVVRTLEPAMEDQLECGPSRVVTGLDLGGDEEAAEHVDFRRHPVSGERAEPSSVLRRGPSLVPGDVQRRPACPSTQSSTSSSTSPMWPRRWVGSPRQAAGARRATRWRRRTGETSRRGGGCRRIRRSRRRLPRSPVRTAEGIARDSSPQKPAGTLSRRLVAVCGEFVPSD